MMWLIEMFVVGLYAATSVVVVIWSLFLRGNRFEGFFIAAIVFIVLWVAIAIIAGLVDVFETDRTRASLVYATVFLVAELAVVLLFIETFNHAMTRQHGPVCEGCRRRGAVKVVDRQSDTYETTMVETQRVTHYGSDGDATGYSEYEYEVPAVTTHTRTRMRCGSCGHAWWVRR